MSNNTVNEASFIMVPSVSASTEIPGPRVSRSQPTLGGSVSGSVQVTTTIGMHKPLEVHVNLIACFALAATRLHFISSILKAFIQKGCRSLFWADFQFFVGLR